MPFIGKALFGFREAQIVADKIHEISGVSAIMNCEIASEPDVERILAKKPRADGMKCSGPAKRIRHGPGLRAKHLRGDAFDPALHFGSGTP